MRTARLAFLLYSVASFISDTATFQPLSPVPDPEPQVFSWTEYNTTAENLFWQSLNEGNSAAASMLLQDNVDPAYTADGGTVPVSVEFISELADQAALGLSTNGLAAKDVNASTYKSTFSQLLHHNLGPVPQATLTQGFAQDIFLTMTAGKQGSSGNMAPPTLGPLLVLADSAGLDDAVQSALTQVQKAGTSAMDIGRTLHDLPSSVDFTALPQTASIAQAAALKVYGVSVAKIQQAQGNATVIGSLLLDTAYLTTSNSLGNATAQNFSDTMLAANLSPGVFGEAYTQAIQQALRQPDADSLTLNATAILITAAVAASSPGAVPAALARAADVPLQRFCQVQGLAKGFSLAAGQAAAASIPALFGADACAEVEDYLTTSSETGNSTTCSPFETGSPATADCQKAIAQLQALGSHPCNVPNTTTTSSPLTPYLLLESGTSLGSVAQSASCQVLIGGAVGSSLPCNQVAEYAKALSRVCSNANGTSGAVFYPAGSIAINSTFIALTTQ